MRQEKGFVNPEELTETNKIRQSSQKENERSREEEKKKETRKKLPIRTPKKIEKKKEPSNDIRKSEKFVTRRVTIRIPKSRKFQPSRRHLKIVKRPRVPISGKGEEELLVPATKPEAKVSFTPATFEQVTSKGVGKAGVKKIVKGRRRVKVRPVQREQFLVRKKQREQASAALNALTEKSQPFRPADEQQNAVEETKKFLHDFEEFARRRTQGQKASEALQQTVIKTKPRPRPLPNPTLDITVQKTETSPIPRPTFGHFPSAPNPRAQSLLAVNGDPRFQQPPRVTEDEFQQVRLTSSLEQPESRDFLRLEDNPEPKVQFESPRSGEGAQRPLVDVPLSFLPASSFFNPSSTPLGRQEQTQRLPMPVALLRQEQTQPKVELRHQPVEQPRPPQEQFIQIGTQPSLQPISEQRPQPFIRLSLPGQEEQLQAVPLVFQQRPDQFLKAQFKTLQAGHAEQQTPTQSPPKSIQLLPQPQFVRFESPKQPEQLLRQQPRLLEQTKHSQRQVLSPLSQSQLPPRRQFVHIQSPRQSVPVRTDQQNPFLRIGSGAKFIELRQVPFPTGSQPRILQVLPSSPVKSTPTNGVSVLGKAPLQESSSIFSRVSFSSPAVSYEY